MTVIDDAEGLERLKRRIEVYVRDYVAGTGKACSLGILGQQFGKTAARYGTDLRTIMKTPWSDERFYKGMTENGASTFVAKE